MENLTNFVEMAEQILAAAESGDMNSLEKHKTRFMEAGGQLYQDLRNQGFKEEEILSGTYLNDARYLQRKG